MTKFTENCPRLLKYIRERNLILNFVIKVYFLKKSREKCFADSKLPVIDDHSKNVCQHVNLFDQICRENFGLKFPFEWTESLSILLITGFLNLQNCVLRFVTNGNVNSHRYVKKLFWNKWMHFKIS